LHPNQLPRRQARERVRWQLDHLRQRTHGRSVAGDIRSLRPRHRRLRRAHPPPEEGRPLDHPAGGPGAVHRIGGTARL
ncbi:hypothetical protein LTR04_004408, partial [Oleoguttula sp. CCFEE 6159]